MSKNIFREMLKPKTTLSRNGFDRSYLHNFTAKIGELLPIMTLETVPGSHYEINVSDMMRTIPMNNAAFIRASQHFEFYFVPYKQLWHRWDDFYTKRSQPLSAGVSFDVPQAAPNCNLAALTQMIANCSSLNLDDQLPTAFAGDLGEAIGAGCAKIYNLLGYGSIKKYTTPYKNNRFPIPSFFSEKSVNLLRAAAYQKICYDYYRQPFYDLPYDGIQYSFNLDDANLSTGVVSSTLLTTDDRAGQRLARCFQLHYRQWKKDLFTGVLPSTQFGAVSVVSTGSSTGSVAIAAQTILGSSISGSVDLESRLIGDFGGINSALTTDGSLSGKLHMQAQTNMIRANFSPSEAKDVVLGNGLSVDPVSGDVSLENEVLGVGSHPISVNDITIPAHSGSVTSSGSFNVLQLVYAQALQRWREITLRSGFRATEQYEGHFGVKPIFSEKDKCVFIDSVSSPLQVNTVVSQTQNDQADLGDLAANASSVLSGNKTIKFDAKDFGVIMCIYSMLPEATYQHDGVDLMNTKILPDDFFVPEFENIGMQGVPMSIFRLGENNLLNGYAARYYEYKVGIDIQADEFAPSETKTIDGTSYQSDAGSFYGWSPSRTIHLSADTAGVTSPALFARDLYVNPTYFRDIFSRLPYATDEAFAGYGPQLTIGLSTFDPFVHQSYFDVKCVQPMSVLGLPRY